VSGTESAIEPLVMEFSVAATAAHAFDTWVRRADIWWPRGHTISGDPAAIEFEPWVDGRIVEHDAYGNAYPWGQVVLWDPPHRVDYLWHLMFTPEEATTVSVTFTESDESTVVRLEQVGWEALGTQGPIRRERTIGGWGTVTAHYRRWVDSPIGDRPMTRPDKENTP
jgi:hypothetical protein